MTVLFKDFHLDITLIRQIWYMPELEQYDRNHKEKSYHILDDRYTKLGYLCT